MWELTHPPTCGTCSKTFTRPEGLKTHLLSSGHGPGIDIDLKGGSVKDPNDMDVDSVNIALFSKRIFKCELNSLKVHFRSIHEGIKPYSCVTCLKSFAHKHLLARHTRVHIQKIADSETMESLEEKAEEEKESEVSNSEKLRKETELKCLLQLTGCDYNLYTKETGRILICPVNANSNLTKNLSCKMQFKRIYDLSRHIDAFHPEVKKNIFNATDISFDNDDRMLSDNIYVGEKLVVMSNITSSMVTANNIVIWNTAGDRYPAIPIT
ncbi:hypothetical protein HK099_006980 [Clydaea vesicula]|uniref:C2H2-type domain-containing protein n=1 Tax=Clydaea vesicula TaxID=447962 RepID=A0AAD5XY96_9FUNG|nr:hypothetical protein HK099_006980 [Clydaea vesicula]